MLIEWSVTLSGTELVISSSAFNDVLSAPQSNSSVQYSAWDLCCRFLISPPLFYAAYAKAFETLDITAVFSGASAARGCAQAVSLIIMSLV